MNKILLHSCCACCACAIVEKLKQEFSVSLFYCDSNIFPKEEWALRLENLQKISNYYNVPLVVTDYEHQQWLSHVRGLENEPEGGNRCEKCFEFRLEKTADFAKKNGFNFFTTSLTISPHKDSKKIFEIARDISKKHKIPFLEIDFKKKCGFERSVKLSRELNLYRQNYCGCEFSLANKQASPKE